METAMTRPCLDAGPGLRYHAVAMGDELTDHERARYDRQLKLPELGEEGQARLAAARVLVVGAGGLGSPALYYLVGAGVGHVTLIDHDRVDVSNLHRQILHGSSDVGRPKHESAAETLADLNPEVVLETLGERLTPDNAVALAKQHDLLIEATDGFDNKFLCNDAAVIAGKPLVTAGVLRWEGQILTVTPRQSACYRCLFVEPPRPESVASPAEAGLIGTAPAVLGALQATEALKLLLGAGQLLHDRLLVVDLLGMEFREVEVRRDPSCAVCGDSPTITGLTPSLYRRDA